MAAGIKTAKRSRRHEDHREVSHKLIVGVLLGYTALVFLFMGVMFGWVMR
jgi:hypothetical protein